MTASRGRTFCSSHPRLESLVPLAADSPARAGVQDAACVRARVSAEAAHHALRRPLLHLWRWARARPITQAADHSRFRCAGLTLECAVAAVALAEAGSARPAF